MGQLFIFLDDKDWIRVLKVLELSHTEQDDEIALKIRMQTGL